jgi:flagellar protein FliJ
MPDTRQLQFLEKIEGDKSDAQAALLAKARMALTAAEAQLAQLKRYEDGYNDQMTAKLGHAISIDALRGHHRFMNNIAQAVRAQDLEVARRRANADAIERVWREFERRRQAFRLMAEKAARDERLLEDRRQQKLSDEFASRRLAHTQSGRL